MNASVIEAVASGGHPTTASAAHPVLQAGVRALLALDAWLAARSRRDADLQALAGMNDHALRDIGLHPLDALASGRGMRTLRDETF